MTLGYADCAKLITTFQNVLIVTHRRPDGDTIGSGFALHFMLKQLGVKSRVECVDAFPAKYGYILEQYHEEEFTPEFVVAVDSASFPLLGDVKTKYGEEFSVDLCIDHHKSNEFFAKSTLLDDTAPATAEMIAVLAENMGVSVDKTIANCIFTGLTTDTGCFRYASVTARTHRVAATLIEAGAEHGEINRIHFESTSKGRLAVEAIARDTMEYYFEDSCALLVLPDDVEEKYGVLQEELDGISSLPRMIEGVLIGLTIRSLKQGVYRISVRTRAPYDASRICRQFDGGGHLYAGGCTIHGEIDEVKQALLEVVGQEIRQELR